jgi:aromatase
MSEVTMSAHTDNSIVIEAPLDLVWQMANDVESWPTLFVGEYARGEVLERTGDRIVFRLTTVPEFSPHNDGKSYSWVSERVLDEEHHYVNARRVELGPFRYMHIFQSFENVPGGVRLRWVQNFEIREGAPFTDEQMAARINHHSREQLENHKRVMEEAARQRSATAGTPAS